MKILVHDYAGYSFPLDLSRELARRGHLVWHVHFQDLQEHKAGCMAETHNEGDLLTVIGLSLGEPFVKRHLFRRRAQDIRYAKLAAGQIAAFRPDVVLSADTPIEIQTRLYTATRKVNARFYFWMQDFYSIAVLKLLPRRVPIAGSLIGHYYKHLERMLLKNSDGIISITHDFLPTIESWGVNLGRCHVIENWGPSELTASTAEIESWKTENGLGGKTVLLYAGTLGLKHNPGLLIDLAHATEHIRDVFVVVVSAGPGAEWLLSQAAADNIQNLRVLPFQPLSSVPRMLASATILLAILEPDAGAFSVPSKVLTYLGAGKPILLSIPLENLAARIVTRIGAGIVTKAGSPRDWVRGALTLLGNHDLQQQCALAAKTYAFEAFEIGRIAGRFESILSPTGRAVPGIPATDSETPVRAAASA